MHASSTALLHKNLHFVVILHPSLLQLSLLAFILHGTSTELTKFEVKMNERERERMALCGLCVYKQELSEPEP